VTAVAYLLVFFAVWIVILWASRRVRGIARFLRLGVLDRLAGAALGFVEAALVVEMLLFVAKRLPGHTLHQYYVHSRLAEPFLHVIPWIDRLFPNIPLR
jgi:uncharacterized membrane protein required for colicin V production